MSEQGDYGGGDVDKPKDGLTLVENPNYDTKEEEVSASVEEEQGSVEDRAEVALETESDSSENAQTNEQVGDPSITPVENMTFSSDEFGEELKKAFKEEEEERLASEQKAPNKFPEDPRRNPNRRDWSIPEKKITENKDPINIIHPDDQETLTLNKNTSDNLEVGEENTQQNTANSVYETSKNVENLDDQGVEKGLSNAAREFEEKRKAVERLNADRYTEPIEEDAAKIHKIVEPETSADTVTEDKKTETHDNVHKIDGGELLGKIPEETPKPAESEEKTPDAPEKQEPVTPIEKSEADEGDAEVQEASNRLKSIQEAEEKESSDVESGAAEAKYNLDLAEKAKMQAVRDAEKLKVDTENVESQASFDQFGLSKENLASVPGFAELSKEQQQMVAGRLQKLTLERIKADAGDTYREQSGEGNVMQRVWHGINKTYKVASLEKTGAENIMKGGLESHGVLLEKLVAGAEKGPQVRKNIAGNLELDFKPEFKNLNASQKNTVERFSANANELAKIPQSWGQESASKEEKRRFNDATEMFEANKKNLIKLKLEEIGSDEAKTLEYIRSVEEAVQMNRFMNTNPELEEELQNIQDQKVWTKALSNVVTERGAYFAMGAIARTATVGALGLLAAPLVASGIGGLRAFNRADETLRERDELARRGIKDESTEAINIKDPKLLAKNIERVINQYQNADNEVLQKKYGSSLKLRIGNLEDLLRKNEISLGDGVDKIDNIESLSLSLSHAEAVLTTIENPTLKHGAQKRLEDWTSRKKKTVEKARSKFKWSSLAKGSTLAAGFAGAGVAAASIADHYDINLNPFSSTEKPSAESPEMVSEKIALPENIKVTGGVSEPIEASPEPLPSYSYEVKSGDNMWNILDSELRTRGYSRDLDTVERIYLTDVLKDKLADMSREELRDIGISSGNIGILAIGDDIDLSRVFNNPDFMGNAWRDANSLTDATTESIQRNIDAASSETTPPLDPETPSETNGGGGPPEEPQSSVEPTAYAEEIAEKTQPISESKEALEIVDDVTKNPTELNIESPNTSREPGGEPPNLSPEQRAIESLDSFGEPSEGAPPLSPERQAEVAQKATDRREWIKNDTARIRNEHGPDSHFRFVAHRLAESNWRHLQYEIIAKDMGLNLKSGDELLFQAGHQPGPPTLNGEKIPIALYREHLLEAEQPQNVHLWESPDKSEDLPIKPQSTETSSVGAAESEVAIQESEIMPQESLHVETVDSGNVVGTEAVQNKIGPQIEAPDYGAEAEIAASTEALPITSRVLTEEELRKYGPEYRKEIDEEMDKLFAARPEEEKFERNAEREMKKKLRTAQRDEQVRHREGQRDFKRSQRELDRDIKNEPDRGDRNKLRFKKVAKNLFFGRNNTQFNSKYDDILNHPDIQDAGRSRMEEWEGSLTTKGIRDMNALAVLDEKFAPPVTEGYAHDLIKNNNRLQFHYYVQELAIYTQPLADESTEKFIIRAKMVRDGRDGLA